MLNFLIMERTKINTVNITEEQVRFKKIGGGSFRLGNRIIKPGQVFMAFPSEIPKGFRDVVVAIDTNFKFEAKPVTKETPPPAPVIVTPPKYSIQPRGKSLYLFDVVDAQGKVLNEKALKKEIAEKFVEDLMK